MEPSLYALLLPVWLCRKVKVLPGIQKAPGGELHATWQPLNRMAVRWFAVEAAIAGRWGLSFGLSVQAPGRKTKR